MSVLCLLSSGESGEGGGLLSSAESGEGEGGGGAVGGSPDWVQFEDQDDSAPEVSCVSLPEAVMRDPPTLHTPYTLHPTHYTLHPTHYTPHFTPFTLHPTPYTLHADHKCMSVLFQRCWLKCIFLMADRKRQTTKRADFSV